MSVALPTLALPLAMLSTLSCAVLAFCTAVAVLALVSAMAVFALSFAMAISALLNLSGIALVARLSSATTFASAPLGFRKCCSAG